MVGPQTDGVIRRQDRPAPASSRDDHELYYAGIDVSLEWASVCVVDASGKIIAEGKVASEPEALISWLLSRGVSLTRAGLEAGPLSQPRRHRLQARMPC